MNPKGKGISCYINKQSDEEKGFTRYYPGVNPCEHRFTINHDESSKEDLYYGDEVNGSFKTCGGDVCERHTEGWQTGMGFLRFVRTNVNHNGLAAVIGGSEEYYIECTKILYDKI